MNYDVNSAIQACSIILQKISSDTIGQTNDLLIDEGDANCLKTGPSTGYDSPVFLNEPVTITDTVRDGSTTDETTPYLFGVAFSYYVQEWYSNTQTHIKFVGVNTSSNDGFSSTPFARKNYGGNWEVHYLTTLSSDGIERTLRDYVIGSMTIAIVDRHVTYTTTLNLDSTIPIPKTNYLNSGIVYLVNIESGQAVLPGYLGVQTLCSNTAAATVQPDLQMRYDVEAPWTLPHGGMTPINYMGTWMYRMGLSFNTSTNVVSLFNSFANIYLMKGFLNVKTD